MTAVNEELKTHPELVNQDPYGRGWVYRMKPTGAPVGLLTAAEYAPLAVSTGHWAGSGGAPQRPRNFGGRLARNAPIPSALSSVAKV